MKELQVTRKTAVRYLDLLDSKGFLEKQKIGRSNFYINRSLFLLFQGETVITENILPIKTINPDY